MAATANGTNGNGRSFALNDVKLSVAALVAVGIQLVGVAWWASDITGRVVFIEKSISDRADVTTRLTKLEVTTEVQGRQIQKDLEAWQAQNQRDLEALRRQIQQIGDMIRK